MTFINPYFNGAHGPSNDEGDIELQAPPEHGESKYWKDQHPQHTGLGPIHRCNIEEWTKTLTTDMDGLAVLQHLQAQTIPPDYLETHKFSISHDSARVNKVTYFCTLFGPIGLLVTVACCVVTPLFGLGPGLYALAAVAFLLLVLPYCLCYGVCTYSCCFCCKTGHFNKCGLPKCYELCIDHDFYSRSHLYSTEAQTYPEVHQTMNRLQENVPVLVFDVQCTNTDAARTSLFTESFRLPIMYSRYSGFNLEQFVQFLNNTISGDVMLGYMSELIIDPRQAHIIPRFKQLLFETYKHKAPMCHVGFRYFTASPQTYSVQKPEKRHFHDVMQQYSVSYQTFDLVAYQQITRELPPTPQLTPAQQNERNYVERFDAFRVVDPQQVTQQFTDHFFALTSHTDNIDILATKHDGPKSKCCLGCWTSMPCWVVSFWTGFLCCAIRQFEAKYTWLVYKPKYHVILPTWDSIEATFVNEIQYRMSPEGEVLHADGPPNPFYLPPYTLSDTSKVIPQVSRIEE